MAKVDFDYVELQQKIFGLVQSAETKLESLATNARSLIVPSDFNYYNYLVNLSTKFKEIKTDVTKFKDFCDKSNNIFEDSVNVLNGSVNSIETLNLEVKSSNVVN